MASQKNYSEVKTELLPISNCLSGRDYFICKGSCQKLGLFARVARKKSLVSAKKLKHRYNLLRTMFDEQMPADNEQSLPTSLDLI